MTKRFRGQECLVIGALFLGTSAKVGAATIYDNSVNDLLTRFSPGTREVGDEILLGSTERYLTNFAFEFYGTNTANPAAFAGSVKAEVRFYLNNGPLFNGYATPGTVLYDSGLFSVPMPVDRGTVRFTEGFGFPVGGVFLGPGPGGTLLSNVTWSVQFSGMGATDEVGLDIYSLPVVGANYPDFWDNNGGWLLQTNTVPMNFSATLEATPEPSALVLSVFGGVGVLIMSRLLKTQQIKSVAVRQRNRDD